MKLIPKWRCIDCLEIYDSPVSECPNCGSKNIRQMRQLDKREMEELKKSIKRLAQAEDQMLYTTNKYEQMYLDSKTHGTAYHIGYKKIALSFWVFVFAIIVIWFSWPIGLVLLGLSIILFLCATLQKLVFNKKNNESYKK